MIKFHLDRLFRRWLRENRHRFTHPPYIVRACHSHLELAFSGISPRVWATLKRNSEVSVGISFKGECWDLVIDFDAYAEQRSSHGWFCRLCAEQGKQELFPSRDALFVAHGLEPFLSWANESFTPETWVCALDPAGRPGLS